MKKRIKTDLLSLFQSNLNYQDCNSSREGVKKSYIYLLIILFFLSVQISSSYAYSLNIANQALCEELNGEWVVPSCDPREGECKEAFCRCPRGLNWNGNYCEMSSKQTLCENSDGEWVDGNCICPENSTGWIEGVGCDYISESHEILGIILIILISILIVSILAYIKVHKRRTKIETFFILFIVTFFTELILVNYGLAQGVPIPLEKDIIKYTPEFMTDNNLLNSPSLTRTQTLYNDTLPIIILLKNQPLHDTTQKINEKYEVTIKDYEIRMEELLNRMRKIDNEQQARKMGIESVREYELSSLTNEEKFQLKQINKEMDEIRDEIKKEVYEEQIQLIKPDQNEVKKIILECGGNITGEGISINSIFARIQPSCLDELKKSDKILAVYEDEKMESHLDKSVCAIGAPTWHYYGYDGGVWDVAIVDTGIDGTHPALNVDYAKTFHNSAILDSDYDDDPNNTDDFHGHGTHMAGVVASTDSTYIGASYGLDTLINAKAGFKETIWFFFKDGRMYQSDAMEAIDWAIFTAGADVISRSFGMCGSGSSDCALARYLDAVVDDLGISVVNSAGNDGPRIGTVGAPAFNIFSVAATDDKNTCGFSGDISDDRIASFSSRGPTADGRVKPDISVPGTNIKSANYNWEGWFGFNPDFVDGSGTSPAAPHVAGSILLILDYKGFRWDPKGVKALILNTANNDGTFSDKNAFGWGVMDLESAYFHKDDVFLNNVEENSYKFYEGTNTQPGDKVTLVWNRHVIYSGAINPSTYYQLNDLDLNLYDESNNNIIDSSTSSVDNVEQVEVNDVYSNVVVKVDAFTTDFYHDSDIEEFALATEEDFESVDPPSFTLKIFNDTLPVEKLKFIITTDVINNGDINAHNTVAMISLPNGMYLDSDTYSKSIGTIRPGIGKSTSWNVIAENNGSYLIKINVNSDSYGEYFTGNSSKIMDIEKDTDGDGDPDITDCNLTNSNIYHGANETCNDIDENCNGQIDENLHRQCGTTDIGVCEYGLETCLAGNWTSCNSTEPDLEICDNLDNDCDGQIDENLTKICGSGNCTGNQTCFEGFWGNCSTYQKDCGICCICNLTGIGIYDSSQNIDCLDTICPPNSCGAGLCDTNIFGSYPESIRNSCLDIGICTFNSCNVTCESDMDNDTYSVNCGDCNDNNPNVYLGALEICDNLDNDCDGQIDEYPNCSTTTTSTTTTSTTSSTVTISPTTTSTTTTTTIPTTSTTTTTTSPPTSTTTTSTTTNSTTSTLKIICDEFTTMCHVSCKGWLCTDEYEYCDYEWESSCGSNYKRIYPGDKADWMVCNQRGSCILRGKPKITATTTTTLPPNGPEIICEKSTISCFHSCKRCPYEGYDYCEYEWDSPCGSSSGILLPGEHTPWLVCTKTGNCVMTGYN